MGGASRGWARVSVLSWRTGASCTTTAAGVCATGTFGASEDVFLETFILASSTAVTVQTYGFGGGANASSIAVPRTA
jgi:hypothetical protein